jgi:ADP-ribose pyrophosphatase YjhB (NUDIX family)
VKPENEILRAARRVQAIAQAGLHYAENEFDRQRYQELRDLSVELSAAATDMDMGKIRDLFTNETGFQTPKVDVRSVVIKDNKILLARERSDGGFSLPGGFADVNNSPSETAVKEVREETGLEVRTSRLLAVIDTDRHSFPPLEYHYYKLVFLCDLIGGKLCDSNETTEAGFFDFDNLPQLSEKRNTGQLFDLIRRQLNSSLTYYD